MALSTFEKQDNLIKRWLIKCDNDNKYGINIVASNIWNIDNTTSHIYELTIFINGKRKDSYRIIKPIYDKYETDVRFKLTQASENTCVMQYYSNH